MSRHRKWKSAVESIDVENRIRRQDKPVLITMLPEEKYRNWTFNAYPIHDLWDALALIYTLTVGEVVNEREENCTWLSSDILPYQ